MTQQDPLPRIRLGRSGGHRGLIRQGLPSRPFEDTYHHLLTLTWLELIGFIAATFLVTNSFFACAYLLQDNNIQNARPGSFLDAFFFSVQTMATIGYGSMYPTTDYANFLVTIEAIIGLLSTALATGLVFARFARPTARVLFSEVAVVTTTQLGIPTLMFRAANQRWNQIVEAQIRVTLARDEKSGNGEYMRRLYDLKLVRNMTPVFAVTWTVMHVIDPDSPLFGSTTESLAETQSELIITMVGIDETLVQTVHARHSFLADEILWDRHFVGILHRDKQGRRYIDYAHFHATLPDASSIPQNTNTSNNEMN
jgi:inward rectifier potassium channel